MAHLCILRLRHVDRMAMRYIHILIPNGGVEERGVAWHGVAERGLACPAAPRCLIYRRAQRRAVTRARRTELGQVL